jgi:hypothetical protein
MLAKKVAEGKALENEAINSVSTSTEQNALLCSKIEDKKSPMTYC